MTLEDLIAPHPCDSFLRDILGRSALYAKGATARFRELVSWNDINFLLEYGGLSFPRLRLIKGEEDLAPTLYSRTGLNGYQRLLNAEFASALRDGAVLAVDSIHQLRPPVSVLCRTLEGQLEVPITADLYASRFDEPEGAPRWNDHEAFVLQVEGKRKWRFYEPTMLYPIAPGSPSPPSGTPVWEGEVADGDVLYIPRGWWYQDSPLDGPSLCLAVTFRNPTGLDLIERLLHRLRSCDLMRMDYPRFGTPESQSYFLRFIQSELATVCAAPGLVIGFLRESRAFAEPRQCFNLPRSLSSELLTPDSDLVVTPLVRFPGEHSIKRSRSDDSVEIYGARGCFREEVAEIFDHICRRPFQTVRGLVGACADRISAETVLSALSEMERYGAISLRSPEMD